MKTIHERKIQKQQKKTKETQKGTKGTETIVKDGELNDFVVHLS